MTTTRWVALAWGLAFSSFLIITPPAGARCVDDLPTVSASSSHSSTTSCGGGSSSCPAGGAARTGYGARSYASASVSWSCRDSGGVYYDVSNGHGCGGAFDDCTRAEGCTGTCYGWWSSTRTWTLGNPDASASVMS